MIIYLGEIRCTHLHKSFMKVCTLYFTYPLLKYFANKEKYLATPAVL